LGRLRRKGGRRLVEAGHGLPLGPPAPLSETTMEPGFACWPDVLSAREGEELAAAACGLPNRSRAGARHLLSSPAVRQLANDRRLVALASTALGAAAHAYRATLFDKSARSNWLVAWHQDTALPVRRRAEIAGWGPWSLKGGVLYAHAPAR